MRGRESTLNRRQVVAEAGSLSSWLPFVPGSHPDGLGRATAGALLLVPVVDSVTLGSSFSVVFRRVVRAFFYGVRTGIKDMARMPLLVFALTLTVSLATFLALLSPVLDQAVDAGTTEVIKGSEVIVYLATGIDVDAASLATEELGDVFGVEHVRLATSGDIASTRRGYEVGSDISHVRTVVLDGRAPQAVVMIGAKEISGVETVDAGVGDRTGMTVELLQTVVPWLTALFGVAGLVLVVNVVLAAARSRRDEAQIMRLVGASWLTVWANLGVVVVVPVIASMLVTTGVVSLASSNLSTFLSPGSTQFAQGSAVMGVGLRLTAVAAIVTVGVSQLGYLAVRR